MTYIPDAAYTNQIVIGGYQESCYVLRVGTVCVRSKYAASYYTVLGRIRSVYVSSGCNSPDLLGVCKHARSGCVGRPDLLGVCLNAPICEVCGVYVYVRYILIVAVLI